MAPFQTDVPSYLVCPLAPTIVVSPSLPIQSNFHYPTWEFTGAELTKVINFLWDQLEPGTPSFVCNTAALPVIKNTHSLPYHDLDDNDALMIGDLPMVLKPSEYKSDDKVPCHICKKDLKISKMHSHVGYHILCKLHTHPDPIF